MARKFLVVIQRHDCLSPWCILRNFLHEKKHWLQKGKLRVGVERKKKRLSVATGRHCHFMPNEKKYFDVIGQHHQSFETALRASSGRTAVIFVMYRAPLYTLIDFYRYISVGITVLLLTLMFMRC